MLDGVVRKVIDPVLDRLAAALAHVGVSANAVTVAAFMLGAGAAFAIALHAYWTGLALLLLSRLGDGIDGAVAKIRGRTDLGGYLDIVLDFAFYGLIPMAFVIADPQRNAVAGAVLLTTFYANGASFLAYAAIAGKRGMETAARGGKSLYFTTGLAEATETIAVFALFCLFPARFPAIAYLFAALTAYTTLSRIVLAAKTLR